MLVGKTVVAIAAGAHHSLALCSDGTVAGWGANGNGELGDNSNGDSNAPVAVDVTGVGREDGEGDCRWGSIQPGVVQRRDSGG